jgi:hypothetical protein
MKAIRNLLILALSLLCGCALVPPGPSALTGTHTASIGFNQGTSVTLNRDGTYRRSVSLFYCTPMVIKSDEGKEETISGWTNSETGTWTVSDRIVFLKADDREIQNPNVEKRYFDDVRSYPVTYKFPHGWVLVYPCWKCVLMRKAPNLPPAPTPLRVTSAADAPVAPRSVAAHR